MYIRCLPNRILVYETRLECISPQRALQRAAPQVENVVVEEEEWFNKNSLTSGRCKRAVCLFRQP